MSPASAIEHGATSVLGMVILGAIGFGTCRFGFPHMFNERIGRVVMVLSLLDAVGLVCWPDGVLVPSSTWKAVYDPQASGAGGYVCTNTASPSCDVVSSPT